MMNPAAPLPALFQELAPDPGGLGVELLDHDRDALPPLAQLFDQDLGHAGDHLGLLLSGVALIDHFDADDRHFALP